MMDTFSYVRAGSLTEAIEHLRDDGAVVHAGGTDLLGCLRDAAVPAKKVVSLSGIEALEGISRDDEGGLSIGVLTTIDTLATDRTIADRYRALSQAAAEVASPQLRNQGTLGGNLCQRPRCWYFRGEFHCLKKGGDVCYAVDGENQYHCIFGGGPCYIVFPSDTAPALAAHGAHLRLAGPDGTRVVSVEEFYRLPRENAERENALKRGEIVTGIHLPAPDRRERSSYRKVRARQVWDFALASTAIALRTEGRRVEEARIFLGGVAPIPWRASAAEQALAGKRLDTDTALAAAEAAVSEAEPLEKNAYKVKLVQGLLQEELEALVR
jgi:xanthine dehydrogenase YagS FAD-binding subunit